MDDIAGLGPDDEITSPPWGEMGRVVTLGLVSLFSKAVLTVANTTEVKNKEVFDEHVMRREAGVGLLSVSNHTSTFDDPGIISAITPWSYFLTEHRHQGIRWAMCAKEICYSNWLFGQFFRNGKTLPVDRKGGVEQPIMNVVASRLAAGDWVHLFPEGRVSYDGQMLPFRRGVGKMVCDCVHQNGSPPIVLPFYHSGMGQVKKKQKMMFGFGNKVEVSVGEPIEIPSELCAKCYAPGVEQGEVWTQITKVIEAAVKDLESSSTPNIDQTKQGGRSGAAKPAAA